MYRTARRAGLSACGGDVSPQAPFLVSGVFRKAWRPPSAVRPRRCPRQPPLRSSHDRKAKTPGADFHPGHLLRLRPSRLRQGLDNDVKAGQVCSKGLPWSGFGQVLLMGRRLLGSIPTEGRPMGWDARQCLPAFYDG